MAEYYKTCPKATPIVPLVNASSSSTSTLADAMLEFNKHRETLLSDNLEEGWASELGLEGKRPDRTGLSNTMHIQMF